MKKLVLVSAVASALAIPALAQAAEESAHTVSANVGVFSNYIFRGVTQTSEELALQGGIDYSHASACILEPGARTSAGSTMPAATATPRRASSWICMAATRALSPRTSPSMSVPSTTTTRASRPAASSAPTHRDLWCAVVEVAVGQAVVLAERVLRQHGLGRHLLLRCLGQHPGRRYRSHGPGARRLPERRRHSGGVSNDDLYGYTDWKLGVSYALPKNVTVGATTPTPMPKRFRTPLAGSTGRQADGGVSAENLLN